jgi:hypothetical protein
MRGAALGGGGSEPRRLAVRFDTAVISGVTEALRQRFRAISHRALAVSSALWGTLVGASVAGQWATVWAAAAVLILDALPTSSRRSVRPWPMAWAVRRVPFPGWLAIRRVFGAAPVYISEVPRPGAGGCGHVPVQYRGRHPLGLC